MSKEITPGPWKVLARSYVGGYVSWIEGGQESKHAAVADVFNEADAHAIAAVPEMIAAMKEWQTFMRQGSVKVDLEAPAVKRFDTAIAKARGKTVEVTNG